MQAVRVPPSAKDRSREVTGASVPVALTVERTVPSAAVSSRVDDVAADGSAPASDP